MLGCDAALSDDEGGKVSFRVRVKTAPYTLQPTPCT